MTLSTPSPRRHARGRACARIGWFYTFVAARRSAYAVWVFVLIALHWFDGSRRPAFPLAVAMTEIPPMQRPGRFRPHGELGLLVGACVAMWRLLPGFLSAASTLDTALTLPGALRPRLEAAD